MTFLAQVHIQLGNERQALELLRRAVVVAPQNVQARKMLAQLQLTSSEPGGAIEALVPVLEVGDFDIFNLLGDALLVEGRPEEAIQRYRAALAQSPDDIRLKLSLAAAYGAAQQFGLALGLLEGTEFGAGPEFSRERILLNILRETGDLDRAEELVDNMASVAADSHVANRVIGEFYYLLGDPEAATEYFLASLRLNPEDSEARIGLAQIEFAAGKISESRRNLQKVIEVEPGHALASLALADVEMSAGNFSSGC